GDATTFEEDGRRISVVLIPPEQQVSRRVDRPASLDEPWTAELRLEAEAPCGPLGGTPHPGRHQQDCEEHLAPENSGGSQGSVFPLVGARLGRAAGRPYKPA